MLSPIASSFTPHLCRPAKQDSSEQVYEGSQATGASLSSTGNVLLVQRGTPNEFSALSQTIDSYGWECFDIEKSVCHWVAAE
eukprot:scaffold467878_cov18-Prasinocladus_malaysianus.AAC.1